MGTSILEFGSRPVDGLVYESWISTACGRLGEYLLEVRFALWIVMTNAELLLKIDNALLAIGPMLTATWANVQSIHRQLIWCRAQISGEPSEPKQGPLTMGLIATREFDMCGDKTELAALINQIQHAFE